MSEWLTAPWGRHRGLGRSWWRLARQCGNGLRDDAWAPVLFVDGRIVMTLLVELRRGLDSRILRPVQARLADPPAEHLVPVGWLQRLWTS